jgi:transposase
MFASPPQGSDLRSILAWHRPINRLLGFFLRVKKILARYRQPLLHLQLVAAHALDLIHYDFFTSGITRDTDSFREKNKKRYFNSFQEDLLPHSSASFLTSRQWALLYPLLPSTNFESGRERGRPPANLLRLLDAVFWKIAHHARWQDLPPGSPPILTCRRFYRRLFLNGRLFIRISFIAQMQTSRPW